MNLMLDDIGRYMAANISALKKGKNFFYDGSPRDEPLISVQLLQVAGEPSDRHFGGVTFYIPYLQVKIRDKDFDAAWDMARDIHLLLDGKGNMNIPDSSGHWYGSILAMTSPQILNPNTDVIQILEPLTLIQEFQVRTKAA